MLLVIIQSARLFAMIVFACSPILTACFAFAMRRREDNAD